MARPGPGNRHPLDGGAVGTLAPLRPLQQQFCNLRVAKGEVAASAPAAVKTNAPHGVQTSRLR